MPLSRSGILPLHISESGWEAASTLHLQFRRPALKMVALSRSGILLLCIWESGWKPLLRYEPHH
jgi:hypothetical protein